MTQVNWATAYEECWAWDCSRPYVAGEFTLVAAKLNVIDLKRKFISKNGQPKAKAIMLCPDHFAELKQRRAANQTGEKRPPVSR